MKNDPLVTILLTLKGRHLFTLRWLWHANRIGLGYPIFIADGEVHPAVATLVEDPSIFPNLRLSYHRYNDLTFSDFYRKLHDSLSRIETPYVMISDNDDFLLPTGVGRNVDYLERALDYVCAGGGIAHFETRPQAGGCPNLVGKITSYWYQQSRAYKAYDLNSTAASERVRTAYAGFLTVYYSVFRVEALRSIAAQMKDRDFKRLDNAELFWILRAATLGKLKSEASHLSYIRQIGTSSNPSREEDFVYSLSNEPYLEEIREIARSIAVLAAEADGVRSDLLYAELTRICAERLRARLVQLLGWRTACKSWLKSRLPEWIFREFRSLAAGIRSGESSAAGGRPTSRNGMFGLMQAAGASPELLAHQRRELADIEASLQGEEFLGFVKRRAPALLQISDRMSPNSVLATRNSAS
jgi:glycosyltransferase domain-containing protein